MAHHLDTIVAAEAQVEHDSVGLGASDEFGGGVGRRGGAEPGEVRFVLEEQFDAAEDDGMVVHGHDPVGLGRQPGSAWRRQRHGHGVNHAADGWGKHAADIGGTNVPCVSETTFPADPA